MKRKSIFKAIVALAVAMAFVMPGSAAFANVRTIGVISNSENTSDINNIEESTNSDITETIIISDTSDNSDTKDTELPTLPTLGTIYVDDDRPSEWYNETQVRTIAEGIINATAGYTVYVYNGTYYEHVTVTKQLNLVGESKENVIVDGSGDGNVVKVPILVNDVSIDTFTITNGSYGIYLESSSNSNIKNCDAYNNEYGIYLYSSSNSEITNCAAYNNEEYGIYLVFSFNNNITNCDVYNNNYGLCLYQSTSKLRDNTIYGNFYDLNIVGYDISHFYQDINPSNTVNGKPIYYLTGQENMILDETYNIGYLGLISCTNITVKNSDVYGVLIANTTDSTISNVNSHNSEIGISLWESSNNIIINCNIYNNNYGIYSWSASNNDITNCNLYNNNYGIYLFLSSNYKLRGNTIYDNGYNFGVETEMYKDYFYHDIDTSNAINGKPIRYLVGQSDLTIDNFGFLGLIDCTNITAKDSDVTGILIVDTTDSTISNVNSHNSGIGIYLWKAFNNDITNCDAYSNNDGIYFYYSSYNNIINCDAYDNSRHGIYMEVASNNNIIIDCDAYNNENGIWLYNANNNKIENSEIYDNSQGGFYLRYSANCTLSDNTIYNNVYNFDIEGWDLSTFYHDIAPANTVNGKSIYYLVEQENLTFDETDNFGYLGMISCTNITAKNADVGGVLIVNTTDSTISNVNSHTSGNGIYFWGASNNDIIGCDAYNNEYGIHLRESSYNNIENCNVYDNKWGIYFNQASNNDIINCNVYDNLYDGIHLFYTTSTNNDIINCNVYGNGLTDDNVMNKNGITFFMEAGNNNVIGCNIHDNSQHGIELFQKVNYVNIENCTIYNNSEYGIDLMQASDNNIENCEIYNNQYGIYAWLMTSKNNIENCKIYNNDKGIYIDMFSGNNNILNCDIYNNNEIGIFIDMMSNSQVIHHNNFINNHQNAKDTGFSTWDDGSEGNYWDDYTGVDEDGNGIGDTPYSIPGGYNNDKYPLMVPIDTIPPVITDVQATPDVQNTTESMNITCIVTDNWDLVDTVKVNISGPDGFTLEATMNEGSYYYEDVYTIMGIYYYFIWANDTSGNIATSDTHSFVITDLETPTSAVQPLPQWTKTVPFTVTATAYDKTGVASVTLYSRYSENGTEWTDWTSYSIDEEMPWSWSFTGSDGYYEFYSIAVDDFGNVEDPPDVADASTGIDTTKPVTTTILDGTMGDNDWFVSTVTVTLSASDTLSGVESTWYRLDSGNWKLYTAPFTVSSEGQHTVEPYSLDRAGNSEDTTSVDFKIDKTLPVTEHEFDGIIGEDGWFVSDVTVTLSATDATSGVNYTKYKIDDGTWMNYTESFDVTKDGDHTLYYYSVDLAGNVEVTNEADFKIDHDILPPVTTHNFDGIMGDNDWFISDVTVTLSAVDFSPSGINHTYYKLDDDAEWQEYTGSFYVTEDGEHTLMYYSVDYLENEEEPKGPFAFKIDKTAPTIDLTVENIGLMKWLLTATVSDETSGVAKVEFYLNGEYLGNVTEPPYEWECTKQGTAQAIVFDNAGNEAISKEVPVSYSQSQSQSNSNLVPVQRKISLILGGLTVIQNTQRRV